MKKDNKFMIGGFIFSGLSLAMAGYFFTQYNSIHGNPIERIEIGGYRVNAEVVSDEVKRKLGLGGRSGLCSNCGMLFIFDEEGTHSFWMKGMKFPIDILWLDNEKVLHIAKNVSHADQIKIYAFDGTAKMVLELPAGTCDEKGIHEGSKVTFDRE